jgi:hypothetical protein
VQGLDVVAPYLHQFGPEVDEDCERPVVVAHDSAFGARTESVRRAHQPNRLLSTE